MKNKKGLIFLVFATLLLFNISFFSAADLLISSQPVSATVINTHDRPATFDFVISNDGLASDFQIYTYERFRIEPSEFSLSNDETKKITFSFYPLDSMKKNEGYVKVPLFFKTKQAGKDVQQSEVVIKLVDFEDAFTVKGENINPDSNTVEVNFYNSEDVKYDNVKVVFTSSFFDDKQESFSMNPYEKKTFLVALDSDKLKKLVYGTYTITAVVTLEDKTTSIEGSVKIIEKSGISVDEQSSGIIIRSATIKKTNEGNVPTVAEVSMRKNIISRLFTTFSIEPNKAERNGFFIDYTWQDELSPDESLNVKATTNWFFPFLIVIFIIIIVTLANMYFSTHLSVNKRVSFVKSKTNDFALKVTVKVKARKFVEKVSVYDQLPAMAKIYEKYGVMPTKMDRDRGRLRWDLPRLAEGEERVFTYVLYSELKVIGKFELPSATAIYESQGKLHEVKSNRVFFINEPTEKKKEEKF